MRPLYRRVVDRNRTRPTQADIAAARGRTVPDVLAPGLRVLFCGINPSLYSAAVGHHFARPGNRFWKALHAAGFTGRLLDPAEDRTLLEHGVGITNLVRAATATAAELGPEDLRRGARRLEAAVRRTRPQIVAFLGLGAYRSAFNRPHASIGPQPERLEPARIWLLPNPSGLNAHHQLPDLTADFRRLLEAARDPSITAR
jgi:TDG/mug DNA glycosylase family protein